METVLGSRCGPYVDQLLVHQKILQLDDFRTCAKRVVAVIQLLGTRVLLYMISFFLCLSTVIHSGSTKEISQEYTTSELSIPLKGYYIWTLRSVFNLSDHPVNKLTFLIFFSVNTLVANYKKCCDLTVVGSEVPHSCLLALPRWCRGENQKGKTL